MTVQRINTQVKGYTILERINYDSWNDGNVIISRNGKRYCHEYYPTAQDRQNKTNSQIGHEILMDFYQSAYIGSQGKTWFMNKYAYPDNKDTSEHFSHYTKAHNALLRLDPDGAETALARAKELLNA